MENETENQTLNKSVNAVDERFTKPIGTIEHEKLQAKPVQCQGVRIDEKLNKEKTKRVGDLVVVICKHPDKDELIEITKCVHIENKSVKESGLWYNEDKEKNLQKGSSVAELLKKYQATILNDLIGKQLETESNNSGYLVIKSY